MYELFVDVPSVTRAFDNLHGLNNVKKLVCGYTLAFRCGRLPALGAYRCLRPVAKLKPLYVSIAYAWHQSILLLLSFLLHDVSRFAIAIRMQDIIAASVTNMRYKPKEVKVLQLYSVCG